jgi:protein-S-isoprenylcysteine O-methyltransferase Ste14
MRPSSIWTIISAVLLLLCLGSFFWGMLRFFSRPAGVSRGAKAIGLCGFAFGFLHLGAIVASPGVGATQALSAAAFYLTALWLFWWAIQANSPRPLSAVLSPDIPEHLMQDGPYRFIRHPFYCSYILTWTAGVVATQQLWLLSTVAVMFGIYLYAAKKEEEKFERSSLGPSYQQYQARTGRFFPNPVKLIAGPAVEVDG